MSTLDILVGARALIASPENWTQGRLAETADGKFVFPKEPIAARFCALGATVHVRGGHLNLDVLARLDAEVPAEFCGLSRDTEKVSLFNDTHSHAEVLALFDRAIAAERAATGVPDLTAQVQVILDEAIAAARGKTPPCRAPASALEAGVTP